MVQVSGKNNPTSEVAMTTGIGMGARAAWEVKFIHFPDTEIFH